MLNNYTIAVRHYATSRKVADSRPDMVKEFVQYVNVLCKYLMYILTDYRLILTNATKDRLYLSSERADPSGTALARTSSNSKLQTRPLA
jgi:hypothetical protein